MGSWQEAVWCVAAGSSGGSEGRGSQRQQRYLEGGATRDAQHILPRTRPVKQRVALSIRARHVQQLSAPQCKGNKPSVRSQTMDGVCRGVTGNNNKS